MAKPVKRTSKKFTAKKPTKAAKKEVKPAKKAKPVKKVVAPAKRTSKVLKPVKTSKVTKTTKPVQKTTKPAAKPAKKQKVAEKRTSKVFKKNTAKPVSVPVPKVTKIKPVKKEPAQKTKVVKKPSTLSEAVVLEKLKEIFPEFNRKRVLENVTLSAKQIKKLLTKHPKFVARIPVDVKDMLDLVDDHVKKAREAAKEATVRKVDQEKAKDVEGILAALDEAKAARGEVQTSKVIKAAQLKLNRRLISIYANIKKINVQFNNFTSVALTESAAAYKSVDPRLSGDISNAVTSVSSAFRIEESNDYDYFESKGSKLDSDDAAPFDAEGDYTDDDDKEMVNVNSLTPPMEAKAADEAPDYDDNESMFNDDSSDSEDSATGPKGKQKITRKKVNKINILGQTRVRYADKAFMATKISETHNLFNGKKRAAVLGFTMGTIDKQGNFSTSAVDYDEQGNAHRKSEMNDVMFGNSPLPFHSDNTLFSDFTSRLARLMGMRRGVGIGLVHICSRQAINFLKLNGFAHNYRIIVRNNADNTGRYGVLIAVRENKNGGSHVLTVPFGILGLAHSELTTLCMGDFAEANDQLLEYITHSILVNGLLSQGKVFGFSLKERALITPPRKTAGVTGGAGDKIIKMANGHIHFLPDIDVRQQFASYKESLKLPETLDSTLTDEDGKTEFDKFAGAIVYTDMESNIAFWYSKSGKLSTTLFNGACELNDRDRADIMKPTPIVAGIQTSEFDPTSASDRETMSPYGAETKFPIRYFGPTLIGQLDGYRRPDGFPGIVGDYVTIRVEQLRDSYQGDRVYWNAVDAAIDNFLHASDEKLDRDQMSHTGNAYTLLDQGNGGLTDADWKTADASNDPKLKGKLTGRDVSAIKIMLHIASKTREEWPTVDVWQKRSEEARVKPPRQEDLDDVVGQYNGLVAGPDGNPATLMPHQAYVLHTLKHQKTAALDCDMGGGKTLMSILDATRWIAEGVDGKPARPCIVMPASLIQNYMTDVKKNFLGSNVNFFVLSSATRSWSKMDNTKVVDIAKSAPVNTVFIASYEWLGLDAYPVITGTRLVKKSVKVDGDDDRKIIMEVPRIDKVFPNPQTLIDIGINVVYLDESQKIKNKSSGFHKAVQVLSGIPVKRIMTGTMVSRDVDDVFTQTSFIDGTMIGTRERFAGMYCEDDKSTEIKKGLEKKVRVHLMASGVMQLRRSMWLGLLPKKEEHFEFVDLEPMQGVVYDVLVNDLLDDSKELEKEAYYLGKNGPLLQEAKHYLGALMFGVDSDNDETETTKDLERLRESAVGDESEDAGDEVDESAGRSKGNKLAKYIERKRSMATKVAMLQAFISSPQALKPKIFSEKAQQQLKALNVELPEHTAKDLRIVELIDKHWDVLGGKYKKMSEQRKNNVSDVSTSMMRGKIIIFALNLATVEHVHAYLKKTKYAPYVVRYLKSDSSANDNLEDFKDPENESAAIIVAAETSVIYGQNMQAADMMIKLTIPWTTGDYDQAVARVYRNGQKLKCEIYNICANGTFEITKLAKFLIRQNSNRKLISEYTNKYNMNHALGSISSGSAAAKLMSGDDLANFVYTDKDTGNDVKLDLLAVHQSVYDHEELEAQRHLKTFRDAGYGDLNTTRIDMFSGKAEISPDDAALLPVSADGKKCEAGPFNLADMAYFDGDNIVNSRNINKKSLTAEIKRQRNLELAQELGADVVDALNQKGANVLLSQYMARAADEILEKNPGFKKFVPGGNTKGFLTFMGQSLREADTRLLFAQNLSANNFAEKAGNDLDDIEVRAELLTFARLVYNRVISNYPGCVAIDDTVEIKYDKKGNAIGIIGYDEKIDVSVIRKNAKVISSIIGRDIKPTEKTHTEKMIEQTKQTKLREKVVQEPIEDEEGDEEDQEEAPTEGINLGVSEMIYFDAEEGDTNATSNDAIYLFAPVAGNDPKMLRKLAKVNIGVGRGNKVFEKKTMWIHSRAVTSMSDVVKVAAMIEQVGGYVEKAGRGIAAKYAITTDIAAQSLLKLKAPANFGKISDLDGGFHTHVAQASTQAATAVAAMKQEVELGLFAFDRRIFIVGECKNTTVLQRSGFKQVQMIRVTFDRSAKLQTQLETCFSRIRKAGLDILNADLISRRLRILVNKKVEV